MCVVLNLKFYRPPKQQRRHEKIKTALPWPARCAAQSNNRGNVSQRSSVEVGSSPPHQLFLFSRKPEWQASRQHVTLLGSFLWSFLPVLPSSVPVCWRWTGEGKLHNSDAPPPSYGCVPACSSVDFWWTSKYPLTSTACKSNKCSEVSSCHFKSLGSVKTINLNTHGCIPVTSLPFTAFFKTCWILACYYWMFCLAGSIDLKGTVHATLNGMLL